MRDEFALIARYLAPLASAWPGAFGLTDDAAVIAPRAGYDLVAKTDALVEGVHFLSDDPADEVAQKLLRVNLSDLAAKGTVPRAYMLTLALGHDTGEAWVEKFVAGLAADQAQFGLSLIGGDTTATTGPKVLSVCAFGEVAAGRMLRRGGARPGDLVCVSGTIGDAALGLLMRQGRDAPLGLSARDFLIARYRVPTPRLALGQALVGLATASLDISDGLVADLGHIAETSSVAVTIEAAKIPLSAAAAELCADDPDLFVHALTGGDDYELAFTVPPAMATALAPLAASLDTPIAVIGRVAPISEAAGAEVAVLDRAGKKIAVDRPGYRHF